MHRLRVCHVFNLYRTNISNSYSPKLQTLQSIHSERRLWCLCNVQSDPKAIYCIHQPNKLIVYGFPIRYWAAPMWPYWSVTRIKTGSPKSLISRSHVQKVSEAMIMHWRAFVKRDKQRPKVIIKFWFCLIEMPASTVHRCLHCLQWAHCIITWSKHGTAWKSLWSLKLLKLAKCIMFVSFWDMVPMAFVHIWHSNWLERCAMKVFSIKASPIN